MLQIRSIQKQKTTILKTHKPRLRLRLPNDPGRKPYLVTAGVHHLSLGQQTRIMGIVNLTPDSFSRDGCIKNKDNIRHALSLARKHIKDGADIIDIGGESTRPGAQRISAQDEIARVIPAVEALTKRSNIPISVDTYKSAVAKAALDAGASMINNIMARNQKPISSKWSRTTMRPLS